MSLSCIAIVVRLLSSLYCRVMYTVFQKKFTLLIFTITKSDVDQFQ